MGLNLLTIENAKTTKGEKRGWLTGILYLKPSNSSGILDLCPNASPGCREACLNTAGRGRMDFVQNGRQRKTELFHKDIGMFLHLLETDIYTILRRASRESLIPCIRLNGTSDIPWERIMGGHIIRAFPHVQFYDYTKRPNRDARFHNYHLTFSLSECNYEQAMIEIAQRHRNVAVVFNKLPKTWQGWNVVDGDVNDLRFLDPSPVIVGLKAKGDAKHDTSGFVQITSCK